MAVTVLIPTTLRSFTNRRSEIKLDGKTVREVIRSLADEYPETKKAIFDENGTPRAFVNVFVNENNIINLAGYDTEVKDGDELMLILAIAGGSPEKSVISDERTEKLTNDEIMRYSRHLLLQEVGVKGQKKLKAAKVLIVGLGGLGTPLAQYLAAAGVGTIGLVDFDEVESSNLQRQVIHGTRDVGRPKVASAKDSIRAINPLVKVETYNLLLTAENALGTITPVAELIAIAHAHGVRILIDGAQSVAHLPVNVTALDADFFVFSGHKIYAPTGIGAVYGKKELLEAANKAGILSLVVDGMSNEKVGEYLNSYGIAVRAGHHCAQPILRSLGLEGTVRATFGIYNTPDEVDRPVKALSSL